MRVVAVPEVTEYLERLVDILYEKGYFGFEEASVSYVASLFEDIIAKLPIRPSKPAPAFFQKYGADLQYTVFPKNKHTTWYVFFTKHWENGKEIYLVRYIANNHVIAQHL
jgi:hypothetical protein